MQDFGQKEAKKLEEIPAAVQFVCGQLEQAGYSAYLVGGCVREMLRGGEVQDWDLTSDALPQKVLNLFSTEAFPTGLRHGTVTVKHQGLPVEITTYRVDGAYCDGRHPQQVTFTRSLAEDLRRRDFTVNAMAMDLRGNLTDLYHGQTDLRQGVIRCVGDPDSRFGEDALRILRGLRFASVMGFSIEEQTAASIHRNQSLLQQIAPERIRVEMDKLLCGRGAADVLLAYPDVLGVFLPEILPSVGFNQRNPHHCYTVWEHTARSVAAVPPERVLRWTMLLHDTGKPSCFSLDTSGVGHFYGHGKASTAMAVRCMERLRFDKKTAEQIKTLVDWHDRDIPRTEKSIRRALSRLGEEGLRQLIAVKRADNLAQHPDFRWVQNEITKAEGIMSSLLTREECFSLRQLAVDGNDMMMLGLRGKEVGAMLERIFKKVLDGTLPNEKDKLLQWTKEKGETDHV